MEYINSLGNWYLHRTKSPKGNGVYYYFTHKQEGEVDLSDKEKYDITENVHYVPMVCLKPQFLKNNDPIHFKKRMDEYLERTKEIRLQKDRERYYKDVEQTRKRSRENYRKNHPLHSPKIKIESFKDYKDYHRLYAQKYRATEQGQLYYEATKKEFGGEKRRRYYELKHIVFKHYSPNLNCACCGESHFGFLTLDHKNNDGGKHRRELGIRGRRADYMLKWIIKNNYPNMFQILCYNCNCSKAHAKYCPHELERQKQTETIMQSLKDDGVTQ
jgi:hypothetical protein